MRLAVPVEGTDPFDWLRGQEIYPKSYWFGREDGLEVGAAGVADLIKDPSLDEISGLRERLAAYSGSAIAPPRYFGGLRFDPERETDELWGAFGAGRFVLPRLELHRLSEGTLLVCNLVLPNDTERGEEVVDEIRRLSPPRPASGALPEALLRADSPGWNDWEAGIERALSEFVRENLGKVVLARRAGFEFGETLDPLQLAADLKNGTPGCFCFYVQPEEGTAFLGASPERLFRRDGRSVLSEAVAGTRPRGTSEADDDDLREELMGSAKDLSEHAYVVSAIRSTLGDLCEDLDIEEHVSEMKLARGRHLVSKIRGTLRQDVSDVEVLKKLHPTPAVGGDPKDRALQTIRELETFDRGWYAGPVGWIGADSAEFAVGIRSGLVRGRTLALYSGAGIVSGSVPEEEWAEIEQKIGDFTRIFGLERSSEYATR